MPANAKFCGTIASLITCIYLFNANFFGVVGTVAIWVPLVATILALPIIQRALPYFSESDPSAICLDEVAGTLVTFGGIKISFLTLLIGFFLFRFFDIIKPGGIKKIEQLPGAWGVVMDDVAAGLYANIGLRLILCGLGLIM